MKRYIAAAWPVDTEDYWMAAGWSSFEAASGQMWAKTKELNTAGMQFIAANTAALLADENMVATFTETYAAACEAFSAKLQEFIVSEQDAQIGTAAKLTANNGIFARVMQVCMDAKVIYADDETMLNLFSFSAVSSLVEPAGASTAIITVINDTTNAPMAAEVEVVGSDKAVLTDASTGKCDIAQLASGTTQFVIRADGYMEAPLTMELETGVASRATVRMMPVVFAFGGDQSSVVNPQSSVFSFQSSVGSGQETAAVGSHF